MTDTSQKITHLLSDQIPDYVQDYYPMFVVFVTKYFEFLEQGSTGVTTSLQNIRLNRDIDTTAENLAVEFLNTYAPSLPNTSALDRSILVKYFRDFYKSKGSEKSFKYFFKAFFNDDIVVQYPRDFMFNTSGGDWYTERSIKVNAQVGQPELLTNTWVTGLTSLAAANISTAINEPSTGGQGIYKMVIENNSAGPSRTATNLLPWSEFHSNSTWGTSSAFVYENVITAPDGTLTADKLVENGINANHYVTDGIPLVAGNYYNFSIFIKAAERTRARLTLNAGYFSNTGVYVDLTTGSVTSLSGSNPVQIIYAGNDWWRIAVSSYCYLSAPTAPSTLFTVYPTVGNNSNYAGTTGSGIYIWGAQASEGKELLDYVKTSGSSSSGTFTGFKFGEPIVGIAYDYVNNITSLVTVTSITDIVSANGVYRNTRSQLSNDQVLQDSVYYQQFSYVIKTKNSYEKWRDYVLDQLHPTGTVLFSEFHADTESYNRATTSFSRVQRTETSVRFRTIKSYLSTQTYTFDRTADYQTGTSTTTTAGAIVYDAAYDYPGENVTWALQGPLDTPVVREITRADGPTFDKLSRKIGTDPQLIQWPYDVNSSIVVRRYNTGYLNYSSVAITGGTVTFNINNTLVTGTGTTFSTQISTGQLITIGTSGINTTAYTVTNIYSNTSIRVTPSSVATQTAVSSYSLRLNVDKTSSIAAGTVIQSITSGTLTYNIGSLPYSTSVGSMILLVTWLKNSRGNSNETANTVQIRFSSTSTIVPYFDDETQRNLYRVALGDSLSNNKLIYYHSSNSVRPQTLLIGKVYTSSNSNVVTGVSTTFGTQLSVGDYVSFYDSSNTATSYLVIGISSNTNIVVSPTPVNNYAGVSSYLLTMSGIPLSANSTKAQVTFKPYNFERGQTFDRFALVIKMDKPEQVNTSLSETFSTANITASGLIASWSSLTTSVSTLSFNSASSTGVYAFSSNCFVFNGIAGQSRFVQTTSFMSTEQLTVSLDYCVGDSYNGGESPDSGEDLEVQYSINGGASWVSASKLWTGGTAQWTLGSVLKPGNVYVSSGSTQVQGSDTLFLTDYVIGDRITIGSSTTTAYTITGITNNNLMTVSPAVVTSSSGIIIPGAVGYFNFYSSTGTITSNGDGTDKVSSVAGISSGVKVTGLTVLNGVQVQITTRIRSYTTGNIRYAYGSGTAVQVGTWTFNGAGGTQVAGEWYVTSFTLTAAGGIGQLLVTSTNRMVFDLDYININGQTAYYKPPVNQQFLTTSLTVYNGVATSAIVRVIQISATDANQDTYAIDNLKVTSTRTQATTGTVNISIAVSSNSTLNISDQDFFDITTIGTL